MADIDHLHVEKFSASIKPQIVWVLRRSSGPFLHVNFMDCSNVTRERTTPRRTTLSHMEWASRFYTKPNWLHGIATDMSLEMIVVPAFMKSHLFNISLDRPLHDRRRKLRWGWRTFPHYIDILVLAKASIHFTISRLVAWTRGSSQYRVTRLTK